MARASGVISEINGCSRRAWTRMLRPAASTRSTRASRMLRALMLLGFSEARMTSEALIETETGWPVGMFVQGRARVVSPKAARVIPLSGRRSMMVTSKMFSTESPAMRGAAADCSQEGSGFVQGDLPAFVEDEGGIGEGDDFGDGVGDVEHGDGEFAVDFLEVAEDASADAEVKGGEGFVE